jgi:CPA2 family monovalent cation:H+ antiporter-2
LGLSAVFGDATSKEVLEAAGLRHARLVLVTTPDLAITRTIVQHAKQINESVRIVARAEGPDEVETLRGLGVYQVVQPEFEAAIEMTRQGLIHFDLPVQRINEYADRVRQKHNTTSDLSFLDQLRNSEAQVDLGWVTVAPGSPLDGATLGEAGIRAKTGASVVSVWRQGKHVPNPDANYKLSAGDVAGVMGTVLQRAAFEAIAGPVDSEEQK